ncbi:MAG: hypothetical protein JNJ88_08715 [Planctomycetes bacterium]|nr:hypothetical protein [Planctomycetota bacterium]
MGRPAPDLLSLLLRQQKGSAVGKAAEGEAAAAAQSGLGPQERTKAEAGRQEPNLRASGEPAPTNAHAKVANTPIPEHARASAHGARGGRGAPVPERPHKQVVLPDTPRRPVTEPLRETDGSAERSLPLPPAVLRSVGYPLLLLVLLGVGYFAAGRLGWLSSNAEGRPAGDPGGSPPSLGNLVPGPGGSAEGVDRGIGASPQASPSGEIAKPKPAGTHAVRAISFSDSESGRTKAQEAVAALAARGFTDARFERVPVAGSSRGEIVVFVGSGESARDPGLLELRERVSAVPPYHAGEKKPPFSDSFVSRVPSTPAGSPSEGTPKTSDGGAR